MNSGSKGNFSEKDLMQDLLTTEKQIISSYSTDLTESSCPNLRRVLVTNFENSEQTQYEVFDAMNKKGWYPTKDAQDNEVQQAKNKSNELMSQLK